MLQKYTMLQNFIQNFIENKCFHIKKVNHNNYECFICFMPHEKNNPIKMLSEFSHIIQKCKCNARIHLLCLNNWIQQKQSCPICRTKCIYLETKLQKYYIVCFINIYVFIIIFYYIYLIVFIFPHILFQIYLHYNLDHVL
jgi:hypothetical protein